MVRRPPRASRTDPLFPYTTLFRSSTVALPAPTKRPDTDRQEELTMAWKLDEGLEGLDHNVLTARVEDLVQWARKSSLWPRSEERRVGKECVSTGRSRWSPYH